MLSATVRYGYHPIASCFLLLLVKRGDGHDGRKIGFGTMGQVDGVQGCSSGEQRLNGLA